MKEIILKGKNYLLVEVTIDAYSFRYKKMPDKQKQLVGTIKDEDGNIGTCYIRENPQGKLIGVLSDILKNENICKRLVENFNYKTLDKWGNELIMWKDYNYQFDNEELFDIDYATDSFLSYLQSIGLDLSKNWVLIQKL